MDRHGSLVAKIGAALALIILAEILIDDGDGDGDGDAEAVGGFAFAWITALFPTRRAIWNGGLARLALIACAGSNFRMSDVQIGHDKTTKFMADQGRQLKAVVVWGEKGLALLRYTHTERYGTD